IYNWTWDFGDGNISYERNPVHRYADGGRYDITLFVKDISSGGNSATKQIIVFNVPPVADFYWTREGNSIKFLDYSSDVDGSVVNWTWDFGDGNISYERNPVHNYTKSGTYDVTLTVKDDDSASNSTTKKINTFNIIPYVNFFWSPIEPTVLDTVQFSDNSSGIDDDIVNWTWDFGDGNISYEQNPSHQFSEKKTYTVTLIVIDERYALNTRSKDIEIVNAPPLVDFSWEPEYPADGELINFTDESHDMDGSVVNWTWDFGDGNISYERNASHAFSESGTYSVNLTVRDNDNASSSIVHNITIANIYVDDDAPPEWYDERHVRTIQEAINNGSEGCHIYVMEGTYRENVVVDKLVIIYGNNAVLDGMGAGNAITVIANKTEIKSLEITNASTGSGIMVEGNNVTIENCVFTDSKIGLCLKGNDTRITNTSISGNIDGVVIYGSRNIIKDSEIIQNSNGTEIITGDGNRIEKNNFLDNFFAIEIKDGDGNEVEKNYFEGNSFAVDVYTDGKCNIDDNNVKGNGNGIRVFSDNSTSVDNNTFGLNTVAILVNGDGNDITNCNIAHNQRGIEVDFSYNVVINGCSFSDNDYGVYVDRSDYITIVNSNFSSHDSDGVYAVNSSRVGVFSSSFSYGGTHIENCTGVEIRYCNYTGGNSGLAITNSQVLVENCSLYETGAAITIYNGNTTIRYSNIYENEIGVKVHGWSVINDCSIYDNNYGIFASEWNGSGRNISLSGNGYGVYLYNSSHSFMENLSATSNDFGIYLKNSSYNTISNSTLSSNKKDLTMYNSSHNTIKNNTIGDGSTAMEIINSRHNIISGNEFKKSYLGLLISYSPLNTFTENRFNGNDYGIDVEGSDVSHFYEDMDVSNKVNGMSVYYMVNSSG
ncbi:MAG: PKD domain-containing protein, partial [Candidatus Thorarchaeota archaeon]